MARSRIKVRNPVARSAWKRKAGPMTAPNAPKGGSHNWRDDLPQDEGEPPNPGPCHEDCECHTDRYYDEWRERQEAEDRYTYEDSLWPGFSDFDDDEE